MKRPVTFALLLMSCSAQQQVARAPSVSAENERYFCRYKKNPVSLQVGAFSLARGGPTVATSSWKDNQPVGLELTVPLEGPQQVQTTFTTGWVTFRLWLTPKHPLELAATEPQKIGDVLELGTQTPLIAIGLVGNAMKLRPELPRSWRPTRAAELVLPCEKTSIVRKPMTWPEDDVPDAPAMTLAENVDIPVSALPGLEPEGVLRLDSSEIVTVLETRGDAVRLRIPLWPARLTGWVDKKFLVPLDALSNVYGMGGLMAQPRSTSKPGALRCGVNVPLFLLRDGALEPAGELRPNAAYEVVSETASFTQISLPENAWLKLEPGLGWALKPGDAALCASKPPPK